MGKQVRTAIEGERARRTHELLRASGRIGQDRNGNYESEAHSRTVKGIGRGKVKTVIERSARHTHSLSRESGDKSGQQYKVRKQGTLTNYEGHQKGQIRPTIENERGVHSHSVEGIGKDNFRTEIKWQRSRRTHSLLRAPGRTS